MCEYKISASLILFYSNFPKKQGSFNHPIFSFVLRIRIGISVKPVVKFLQAFCELVAG